MAVVASGSAGVPAISRLTLGFFRRIVRGYLRRSFHAVRVQSAERFTKSSGPLIVYANHGSWWDPMVSILLASKLMPRRPHYAPMDAQALERYGILGKIGIFGVELDTRRGAVQFLRTGEAVLTHGGVLWVTPQGRFVDARDRPLRFKPGLAALAARVAEAQGSCTVLPLAIEYTFWDERTPECLLAFGEAVRVQRGASTASLDGVFERALMVTMDCLQQSSMRRDQREFQTLHAGRVGTGGFYGLGQRVKAFVLRQEYRAEHTVRGGGRP